MQTQITNTETMENSSKAEALKIKMLNLNEAQINGILLNISEWSGEMEIERLIDDLFWSDKWNLKTDSELLTEANRLAEWFPSIWFTKDKFNAAVQQYFASSLQPDNKYIN